MRDLIFRASWPTKSKVVDGLFIHRITNWTAIQFFQSTMVLAGSPATGALPPTPGGCAVRLEIDHSTDKDRTEAFAATSLVPIYNELVTLASENAEKGERP
jgi:hypothetical protein